MTARRRPHIAWLLLPLASLAAGVAITAQWSGATAERRESRSISWRIGEPPPPAPLTPGRYVLEADDPDAVEPPTEDGIRITLRPIPVGAAAELEPWPAGPDLVGAGSPLAVFTIDRAGQYEVAVENAREGAMVTIAPAPAAIDDARGRTLEVAARAASIVPAIAGAFIGLALAAGWLALRRRSSLRALVPEGVEEQGEV